MSSKAEIAALINDWAFFRDQQKWDDLLGVFHHDGTISISWIACPYPDFVAVSKLASANTDLSLKHHVGVPMIALHGERATSEVNVTIIVRAKTSFGEIDATAFARFFDLIERRDGHWKILKRTAIYEKDRADPVDRPALPEAFFTGLDAYPTELRFFASTLKELGVPLSKTLVLDKSPEMHGLYVHGAAWLSAG